MYDEKIKRLRAMLEVAVEQGVMIFQAGKPATVQDIIDIQRVCENFNYMPEFIVKNFNGEMKEIWYGDVATLNRG